MATNTQPTQPMMGSQLYSQVNAQLNQGPGSGPLGGAGYSGGAAPGSTMGGSQLPNLSGYAMPNMNPLGAASQMGQANPFGSDGGSPFGGGMGGGVGDSLKKLVDTNKDLIAAIKDLTKNIKGVGGGGPGGMPGMGGGLFGGQGSGLGGGLADRLLSNIARGRGGMIDRENIDAMSGALGTDAGQNLMNQNAGLFQATAGGPPTPTIYRGGMHVPNPAYAQYHQNQAQLGVGNAAMGALNDLYNPQGRLPMPGRFSGVGVRQGLSNFVRASFGMPQQMSADYQAATYNAASAQLESQLGAGTPANAIAQAALQQNFGNGQGLPANSTSGSKYLGRAANASARVIGSGGTNMSQIVSQIPYVGGILAAPLNVLENRLQGALPGELPGIIHSGYGQGGAQGSGFINTHADFLRQMRNNLGVGAIEALGMGNQVLNLASGGAVPGGLATGITRAIASGVNIGDVGVNASFSRAGMNLSGSGYTGDKAIRTALGMGLRGQGVSDFLGAVGGLGGQFSAMGIDLSASDRRASKDIADIHRSGFASLRGKGAVEGYSRMRQKGGIAAAQSLGGMFGGVGQELLMASALDETGGNFSEAGAILENMSPFENRRRIAEMLGVSENDETVQMIMMGQGLSYAERNIKKGSGKEIRGRYKGGEQADAIFTKAQSKADASRLEDSYGDNKENLLELIRINKKIEDKLTEGITVQDLEGLVTTVAYISNKVNYAASKIASIANTIGQIWNWISSKFSDERLKWDVVDTGDKINGLTIYQWKYKTDIEQRTYQGVMAQEVMKLFPDAVNKQFGRYYSVDYSKIGIEFKEVAA